MSRTMTVLAALAITAGMAAGETMAQDGTPDPASDAEAATAGLTGETHTDEVVFARRILMTGIGREMDKIIGMTEPGGTFDPAAATEAADTISTMLLAFPHLFPPQTDTWTAEREEEMPAMVSLSLPTVWQDFGDFYDRAQAASRLALDASFAGSEAEFRASAEQLQAACDACHEQYRRY